jgi:hypothetical protein
LRGSRSTAGGMSEITDDLPQAEELT